MTNEGVVAHVLHPRRAVDGIRFGVPLDIELAGAREFPLHPGSAPVLIADAIGIRVHRSYAGIVHEVEVLDPGQLEWEGMVFLGRPILEVVEDLRARGARVRRRKDIEAEAVSHGLSLFAEHGIVVSVTASDPDHPMPVPTREDIFASLGMKNPWADA